jgi:hypothetical protein
MIFYPLEKIKAFGNSESPITYGVKNSDRDIKQRYYRLKMVDENGDLEYTDLISGRHCKISNDIISTIIQFESILKIQCSEDANMTIINQLGEIIFQSSEYKTMFMFDLKMISAGLYYITVKNEDGKIESKKILLAN